MMSSTRMAPITVTIVFRQRCIELSMSSLPDSSYCCIKKYSETFGASVS